MRFSFRNIWRVGKSILPYAATWLFRKFRPKDKQLADLLETVLAIVLEEVLAQSPVIREDLVPKLMTEKLKGRFPTLSETELLKISSDYCKRDNRLRNKMSWR